MDIHLIRNKTRLHGFTLIEMSIILVIIGLVIGGVLVGRDLVAAARANKYIASIQEMKVNVNLFLDKFSYLPGDMPNATSFWSGTDDGNGDGIVIRTGSWATTETPFVWQHMTLAGYAEGGQYRQITHQIGGYGYSLQYTSSLHGFGYMSSGGKSNNRLYPTTETTAISPAHGYRIDKKFDDGKPGVGKILAGPARQDKSTNPCAADDDNTSNVTPSTAYYYDMSTSSNRCILSFSLD